MNFNIRKHIQEWRRVLLVSTKPDKDEFKTSSKITAIGMIILGAIGFIIFMIVRFMGGIA